MRASARAAGMKRLQPKDFIVDEASLVGVIARVIATCRYYIIALIIARVIAVIARVIAIIAHFNSEFAINQAIT